MPDKIKTDDIIVVEGKYDRIKLSEIVEGIILETDGFAVFSEEELKNTLINLSKSRDIIILTDGDAAGFRIRNYVSSFLPKDKVKHALIPDVFGKEKRKAAPSKEGKLGVEGIDIEIIRDSLINAGINRSSIENSDPVTVADLYELGFSGKKGSADKRRKLLSALKLPQRTGTHLMLAIINSTMDKNEFIGFVKGFERG